LADTSDTNSAQRGATVTVTATANGFSDGSTITITGAWPLMAVLTALMVRKSLLLLTSMHLLT